MKKIVIPIICIILLVIGITMCYFNSYDDELVAINEVKTDYRYENIIYNQEENIMSDDVLGILTIEKIGLKATVKEGTSNQILKEYIGHIEETSTYDGNIGLAAHNRGNKYSYFARINELEKGDVLTYETKFYKRQYKVDNIQVIFETDWGLLQNTEENKITMITCIKNKRNQRLCVQASEI